MGLCLADTVGRYLLTWVAAWLVHAVMAPRQHELVSYLPRTRSYWEDTAFYLWGDTTFARVGLLVGVPSLFIILLFGLLNERRGAAFRIPLAGLLLLPTWFLPFGNFLATLVVPVLAQVAFALFLMPVPLVRLPPEAAGRSHGRVRVERGRTDRAPRVDARNGPGSPARPRERTGRTPGGTPAPPVLPEAGADVEALSTRPRAHPSDAGPPAPER
ncbi:hypothetical protein ACFU6R_11190 [Streptomyces sp. NPDC057499]|uniref:hypothetical protein n=1 Tax=Streptomyces sp. NPDC057499 TaxID=3346150 RepID=UPI0036D1A5CF